MKVRLIVAGLAALLMSALVASGASALVAKNVGSKASLGKKAGNGSTAGTGGKREKTSGARYECEDKDSDGSPDVVLTSNGTTYAWPPNHKYRPMAITAVEEDSDDSITLNSTGSHDQFIAGEELNGSGNTAYTSDVDPMTITKTDTGTVTTTQNFRGERSGRDKTGRTYFFDTFVTYENDLGMMETCDPPKEAFTAFVPHDQGQNSEAPTTTTARR